MLNGFERVLTKSKQDQYLVQRYIFIVVCLWERDLSYLAIHLDPQRRGILNDLGGKRMKDWQAEAAVLNDFQVKRKRQKWAYFSSYLPKDLHEGPLELWPPNIFG